MANIYTKIYRILNTDYNPEQEGQNDNGHAISPLNENQFRRTLSNIIRLMNDYKVIDLKEDILQETFTIVCKKQVSAIQTGELSHMKMATPHTEYSLTNYLRCPKNYTSPRS